MPSLVPERLRQSRRDASFFSISNYIAGYVEQVFRMVLLGQVVVLVAPLGSGKSEVLRRVGQHVDAKRGWRSVSLDMGDADPPRTPRELWRDVARFTRAGMEMVSLENPSAIKLLRAHALNGRDHIVILIDHAELIDEDWLFTELRTAVDASLSDEDSRAPVTVVVASTETLAHRLFSATSPFHGVGQQISMTNCGLDSRRAYWSERLRAIRGSRREVLIDSLDALCGGDPYQIESMSAFLAAQTSGRITAERIYDTLRAARANPARVAPLLRRYGELVEADPNSFSLALRLLDNDPEVLVASQTEASLAHAGFWRGVFSNDGNVWSFRSGLTERFFRQEFQNHPERIAAAHVRHGAYAEATLALAARRDRYPNGQDTLVATITQWVKASSSPSQAWQNAASALSLCFGPATRVFRYAPFRQIRTEADVHYFEVRPGEIEMPVAPDAAMTLRAAHDERVDASAPGEICLRPATVPWRDSSGDFVVFPLSHRFRPYGAVILPQSGFSPDGDTDAHAHRDRENRWQSALSAIFREIVASETRALGGADLSQAQRDVQAELTRGGDGLARAQWLALAAITGGFGLRFNRAALFRIVGATRLEGVDAIGYHAQDDQERAWIRAPQDLDRTLALLRASATGSPPPVALSPMSGEAHQFSIPDWRSDAFLRRVLIHGNITLCETGDLVDSALVALFHVEGAVRRPHNPALIVPLRESERLVGVLVIDKPFADEPVTQEQLDALPALAFQLSLTLRSAEDAELRSMFDQIRAIGTERLTYQEAADRLADIVVKAMRTSISYFVLGTWEASSESAAPDRRQAVLRVVRSSEGNNLLNGRLLYAYYSIEQESWGPVYEALREGLLDISDVRQWRVDHPHVPLIEIDDEVKAVISIPIGGSYTAPRAVVSFQTVALAGFGSRERLLFERIAEAAEKVLASSQQYESLESGRYLTAQLSQSLTRLVEPVTDDDLYVAILDQLRAFFKYDTESWQVDRLPDSAALFAVSGGRPRTVVASHNPSLALALARDCSRLREAALSEGSAYVEFADRELLAREKYGNTDCLSHHSVGAEASVWCAIGDGLLIVLAWKGPRRFSSAERRNLPLLTTIAERTSVVINAERQRLRGQLANSLRVEDFELIEAEQTHQWNRRMRAIRNNAQWAIESLSHSMGVAESAEALKRLDRIAQEAAQAQSRLIYGRFKQIETLAIVRWVHECVEDWRSLHGKLDWLDNAIVGSDGFTIATRPVVLRWILYELLTNAEEAEAQNLNPRISVAVLRDPLTGDAQIVVDNSTPLPRLTQELLKNKSPLANPNNIARGRGLWIVSRQVPTLLGGILEIPASTAASTRFILRLPERLAD